MSQTSRKVSHAGLRTRGRSRRWRGGFAVALAALGAVSLGTSAWAQAPPAEAAAAAPSEAGEAQGAVVRVQVVAGEPPQALPGQEVELLALGPRSRKPVRTWTATSDEQGWTEFRAVEAEGGQRILARTRYQDIDWDSLTSALLPSTELRLQVYERSVDPALLRLVRVETELDVWEELLIVRQQFHLGSRGPKALDLGRDPAGRRSSLRIPLPQGAKGVSARGEDVAASDGELRFSGVVKPGEVGQTISVSYQLPIVGATLSLRQTFPLPAEELLTVLPEHPVVRGVEQRRWRARLLARDGQRVEAQQDREGRSMWVGRAQREGGLPALDLSLSGLPARDRLPAWLAVGLVVLALVAGAWVARRRAAGPAGAPARDQLVQRLAQLERERRGQGLSPAQLDEERRLFALALSRDDGSPQR